MKEQSKNILILIMVMLLAVLDINNIFSQTVSGKYSIDDPWKKIVTKNNLEISFLFYEKANNIKNGVVLKLNNKNPYSIKYSFNLIFKAESKIKTRLLEGTLKALEKKTGSNDNLFFLPFEPGISIAEVGISRLKIVIIK